MNEVQYFRGVAGKLKLGTSVGDLSLFGFYSDNYIDASIDTTLNMLSSSYEDGNHRTESEINRRNSAKLLGGRLFYESKILGTTKIGLTYYKSEYNMPFEYKGLYDFSGTQSNALGIDYDIVYKNINIFGEWARSYTDKVGGIDGVRNSCFLSWLMLYSWCAITLRILSCCTHTDSVSRAVHHRMSSEFLPVSASK